MIKKFIKVPLLVALLLLAPGVSLATKIDDILKSNLTTYDNFPREGVQFIDISPALKNPVAFRAIIDQFAKHYAHKKIDAILGLEARGFVLGAALAYKLQVPFIMARKPGKLPGEVISATFTKEYGIDILGIQKDAIKPGDNILIVDDLIATGGTAMAAQELITKAGGKVIELAVVIDLSKLLAASKEFNIPVYALQKH